MSIFYKSSTEFNLVDDNTIDEPLLPNTIQTTKATASMLSRNSLSLGFVTGVFIQLSSLGAHALTMAVLGCSTTMEHSFVLSMVWSLLLCGSGLSILWSAISMVLHRRGGKNNQHNHGYGGMSTSMVKTTMESRFLAGLVASLSISCILLDYVLEHTFRWGVALVGVALASLHWHASHLILGEDDEEGNDVDPAKTKKDENDLYEDV